MAIFACAIGLAVIAVLAPERVWRDKALSVVWVVAIVSVFWVAARVAEANLT